MDFEIIQGNLLPSTVTDRQIEFQGQHTDLSDDFWLDFRSFSRSHDKKKRELRPGWQKTSRRNKFIYHQKYEEEEKVKKSCQNA